MLDEKFVDLSSVYTTPQSGRLPLVDLSSTYNTPESGKILKSRPKPIPTTETPSEPLLPDNLYGHEFEMDRAAC